MSGLGEIKEKYQTLKLLLRHALIHLKFDMLWYTLKLILRHALIHLIFKHTLIPKLNNQMRMSKFSRC